MSQLSLTSLQARNLILYSQRLLAPRGIPAQKSDLVDLIQELGVLQIDTIHVVARSPYFSLWSRLGNYDPDWLNQLLAKKQIFEGWAHAASFLPVQDYPYHRRLILENMRLPRYRLWYAQHKKECDDMLAYIRKHGPVKSSDFKRSDGMKGGWWNWKIEKDALEYWFAAGKLMIARRENFHRVYDLSERILPDWDDRRAPTLEESLDYLVLKSVRAIGVALSAWVADYFRLPKALVNRSLHRLVESGQIQPVEVRGWSETAWADPSRVENFLDLGLPSQRPSHTTVLSPFDSLVWDRARARHVFKFDFAIECYLPAEKRKYGYFLLPILYRGNLVGRADAKAHRKEGIFEVKSFYLDPTVKPTTAMAKAIIIALRQCAEWHNTPSLQISKCEPSGFLD